jgi:hypothetical protein
MKMSKKWFALIFLIASVNMFPAVAHEDMGHIRVGHFVADGPNVDVFFDGEAVLEDFAPRSLSDFLDVQPGNISVAIAPTGEGVEEAIIGPVDMNVENGHSYSVSVIGQVDDNSMMPLVIDETTAMGDCDMSTSVFRILINNISGLPAISFYENDMWVEKNIAYGSYSAACTPAFFWDTGKAVEGEDLEKIVFDFDSEEDGNGAFWEPYTVYMWGLMGNYPGTPDEDYYFGGGNWHTVAPDPTTFLSAFSGLELTFTGDPIYQFDTAVQAIQTAGLEETIADEKPLTLFIPTDQAFADLGDALHNLVANPEELRDALLYHVLDGAMTYDDLVAAETVMTLQGSSIDIGVSEDDGVTFTINQNATVQNFPYTLPNGTLVYFIDNQVLMPPSS